MMRVPLILAACLALCGCELLDLIPESTPPQENIAKAWRSEPVDGRRIRRVAILPFADLTGHPETPQDVVVALEAALQRRQSYDIVLLPYSVLTEREERDFHEDATLNEETLVRLHRTFNVDAVILGTITHYRAYSPLQLGLKISMFSAGAGDVVWEVNALYDARLKEVVKDVHNYHDTKLAPTDSLEDYRVILMSPTQFTEYACARIVETL